MMFTVITAVRIVTSFLRSTRTHLFVFLKKGRKGKEKHTPCNRFFNGGFSLLLSLETDSGEDLF